jgi:hypothetical protein
MKKALLVLAMALMVLTGCTNDSGMREVLEREGYTNIQPTGYRLFLCSQDDFYHTGFVAEKNGRKVSGAVCEGMFFKGKTIRYD